MPDHIGILLRHRLMAKKGAGMKSNEQKTINARHCDVASDLLIDAAAFFKDVADHNPDMKETMLHNANVYKRFANLVKKDPLGKCTS